MSSMRHPRDFHREKRHRSASYVSADEENLVEPQDSSEKRSLMISDYHFRRMNAKAGTGTLNYNYYDRSRRSPERETYLFMNAPEEAADSDDSDDGGTEETALINANENANVENNSSSSGSASSTNSSKNSESVAGPGSGSSSSGSSSSGAVAGGPDEARESAQLRGSQQQSTSSRQSNLNGPSGSQVRADSSRQEPSNSNRASSREEPANSDQSSSADSVGDDADSEKGTTNSKGSKGKGKKGRKSAAATGSNDVNNSKTGSHISDPNTPNSGLLHELHSNEPIAPSIKAGAKATGPNLVPKAAASKFGKAPAASKAKAEAPGRKSSSRLSSSKAKISAPEPKPKSEGSDAANAPESDSKPPLTKAQLLSRQKRAEALMGYEFLDPLDPIIPPEQPIQVLYAFPEEIRTSNGQPDDYAFLRFNKESACVLSCIWTSVMTFFMGMFLGTIQGAASSGISAYMSHIMGGIFKKYESMMGGMGQAQGNGADFNPAERIGKADGSDGKIPPSKWTWDKVIGLEQQKTDVYAGIMASFEKQYADIMVPPKGILMYGPPGTGKSMISEAVANEFGHIRYGQFTSADIQSKWIGQTAKNMNAIFVAAGSDVPCLIFMDEIENMFPTEGSGGHSADSAGQKDALEMFLIHMSGGKEVAGVIVIGATNYPWRLPMAVLSRFALKVHVTLPPAGDILTYFTQRMEEVETESKRRTKSIDAPAIVEMHTGDLTKKDNIQLTELARKCADKRLAMRDLNNIVNNAKNAAIQRFRKKEAGGQKLIRGKNYTIDLNFHDMEEAVRTAKTSVSRKQVQMYYDYHMGKTINQMDIKDGDGKTGAVKRSHVDTMGFEDKRDFED